MTDGWLLMVVKVALAWFLVVNLATTPRRLAILCLCLVAGSIVTSVGGILRYLSGEELSQGFRTLWLGAYGDPNYLAEYLAMTVPLAVAFIARRGDAVVGPPALRGGAAPRGHLHRPDLLPRRLPRRGRSADWSGRCASGRSATKALVLSAALAVGVAIFAPATYWERNDTLEEFEQDQSALGRVYAWHVASSVNLDHPLRGVGGGAFREAWPSTHPPEVREQPLVAHNIFLDTLGELGWVGFFLFLTFAGSATGAVFRAGSDPEIGWLARGIGASVAGFLLCNCFSGSLAAPQLFVLFGLAGAAERVAARDGRARGRGSPAGHGGFVGCAMRIGMAVEGMGRDGRAGGCWPAVALLLDLAADGRVVPSRRGGGGGGAGCGAERSGGGGEPRALRSLAARAAVLALAGLRSPRRRGLPRPRGRRALLDAAPRRRRRPCS